MPVPTPTSRMRPPTRSAAAIEVLAALRERRAEDEIVDRSKARPLRIGLRHRVVAQLARHRHVTLLPYNFPDAACPSCAMSAARIVANDAGLCGVVIKYFFDSHSQTTGRKPASADLFPPAPPPAAGIGRIGHILDESAAQHPRLAVRRVIEHAGLPGRNPVLAAGQFDLDPLRRNGAARPAAAAASSAP